MNNLINSNPDTEELVDRVLYGNNEKGGIGFILSSDVFRWMYESRSADVIELMKEMDELIKQGINVSDDKIDHLIELLEGELK